MKDITEMIKIGRVSSVNVKSRKARVVFEDKQDMVSAELDVLQNQPLIKITKLDDGDKWEGVGSYNSAPRDLGDDTYIKKLPDKVDIQKKITYQGETHLHEEHVEIHPWLPYVGQMVLCVFIPIGNGEGFVVGAF